MIILSPIKLDHLFTQNKTAFNESLEEQKNATQKRTTTRETLDRDQDDERVSSERLLRDGEREGRRNVARPKRCRRVRHRDSVTNSRKTQGGVSSETNEENEEEAAVMGVGRSL